MKNLQKGGKENDLLHNCIRENDGDADDTTTRATLWEEATFELFGRNAEQKPRMRWVVVTDNGGTRQLRIKWERATENVRSARAAV